MTRKQTEQPALSRRAKQEGPHSYLPAPPALFSGVVPEARAGRNLYLGTPVSSPGFLHEGQPVEYLHPEAGSVEIEQYTGAMRRLDARKDR